VSKERKEKGGEKEKARKWPSERGSKVGQCFLGRDKKAETKEGTQGEG